jgi:putative zinc finger protein
MMAEHDDVSALIPWYVNGSISELDRQKVDSHLRACGICRDDLVVEYRVYRAMAADTAIEYMPATSLKRLQARLDGLDAKSAAWDPAVVERPPSRSRRGTPWRGLAAASVAVLAVALSLAAADRWIQFRAKAWSPNYYTVTATQARSPDEVIRAVFSPSVTLVELQSILDEAQLKIISGPTEAGVYSLAAKSVRPVSSSLALLRRHAEVRFAEATQPGVKSGDAAGSGQFP